MAHWLQHPEVLEFLPLGFLRKGHYVDPALPSELPFPPGSRAALITPQPWPFQGWGALAHLDEAGVPLKEPLPTTTAWPSSVPVCLGCPTPGRRAPPRKERVGSPLATTSTDHLVLLLWLAGVSNTNIFPLGVLTLQKPLSAGNTLLTNAGNPALLTNAGNPASSLRPGFQSLALKGRHSHQPSGTPQGQDLEAEKQTTPHHA